MLCKILYNAKVILPTLPVRKTFALTLCIILPFYQEPLFSTAILILEPLCSLDVQHICFQAKTKIMS